MKERYEYLLSLEKMGLLDNIEWVELLRLKKEMSK